MKVSKWACNFCDRTEDDVANIVVGPSDVAICDECVVTCSEIIADANKPAGATVTVTINNVGWPVELHADAGLIPRSTSEAELRADADRVAAFGRLAR
ncbi:ClpX C4-type zinc finger protein [Burkholderia cenocepacia]|uniref:ClpX C4-type zinc finger protein n=1 Tax=Burkholderia cenocepacia TaxID=95486 RepID=UPI002AB70BA4|nr:ClpX C4-type zinc finger protein [Burkholderia cenocepacia]